MAQEKQSAREAQDAFHEHLGTCKQCDNNPFDLCPVGAKLIVEAHRELVDSTLAALKG